MCHQQKHDRNVNKRVSELFTKRLSISSHLNFLHQVTIKQAFPSLALAKWVIACWNLTNMLKETTFWKYIFKCRHVSHVIRVYWYTGLKTTLWAFRFGRLSQKSNSDTNVFSSKFIKLIFMFLKEIVFSPIVIRSLNAWNESRKNWTRVRKSEALWTVQGLYAVFMSNFICSYE